MIENCEHKTAVITHETPDNDGYYQIEFCTYGCHRYFLKHTNSDGLVVSHERLSALLVAFLKTAGLIDGEWEEGFLQAAYAYEESIREQRERGAAETERIGGLDDEILF